MTYLRALSEQASLSSIGLRARPGAVSVLANHSGLVRTSVVRRWLTRWRHFANKTPGRVFGDVWSAAPPWDVASKVVGLTRSAICFTSDGLDDAGRGTMTAIPDGLSCEKTGQGESAGATWLTGFEIRMVPSTAHVGWSGMPTPRSICDGAIVQEESAWSSTSPSVHYSSDFKRRRNDALIEK